MAEVYATGLLTRVVDPGRLRSGRIVLDHLFWRILCQIRNIKYCAEPSVSDHPSTRVVFRGEQILRNCYESRRPPRNTIRVFRRYITAQIKLLELRATLSDEDNVIAKRGTRGGIGSFNPPCINAICLVIPAISRIGKRVKSSAYSKATDL